MHKLALLVAAVLVAVSVAGHARAEVDTASAERIRAVIAEQIDAFMADDAERAFSFASPSIQRQFGNPRNFMAMVRQGYEPVYRPSSVEFMEMGEGPRGLYQDVYVVGPNGAPVIARYFMQQQSNGSWRISGCLLLETADLTT